MNIHEQLKMLIWAHAASFENLNCAMDWIYDAKVQWKTIHRFNVWGPILLPYTHHEKDVTNENAFE